MKFKDKVRLIKKLEDDYKYLREEIDKLTSCGVDLKFFDVVEDLFDSYLQAVEEGVDDREGWVHWWMYDKPSESAKVIIDGTEIVVDSVETLVKIIDKSN